MKLLPFENITFKTKLNENEISSRLINYIEPQAIFGFKPYNRRSKMPYEGQVIEQSFKIRRIIRYRNSLLPIISGTIKKENDNTIINIKMELQIISKILLSAWSLIIVIVLINFLIRFFQNSEFNSQIFFPFGFLLFLYITTMYFFKNESNKSINDLQKLFEADIIKN